jgi:hypothetical protein
MLLWLRAAEGCANAYYAADDKGQPAGAAKMFGEAKGDVPETMAVVPMQFGITLNRTGRFTLELTATDVLTGKTSMVAFPVRVLTPCWKSESL